MANKTKAQIQAINDIVIAIVFNIRSWPLVNAPSGIPLPIIFELAGINEKRVEDVAAVATQVVISPTPATTCPATKEEAEVDRVNMQIPPIIVTTAAR